MRLFPIFLRIAGRPCLVVGGGSVGQAKIGSLLRAGARVRVVAPEVTRQVRSWARADRVRWEARSFRSGDLDGVFLVVAATSSPRLHERILRLARRRGVLCNVVDDPARCDFYYPAVVRRGDLQIAISTGGSSPALAQRLRRELEKQFGPEYEAWVEHLRAARNGMRARALDQRTRQKLSHRLASPGQFKDFVRATRSTARRPAVL